MNYKQLLQLVNNLNSVIGSQETKTAKKLIQIYNKVKLLHEAYNSEVENLRLDAASTDDKDCLLLNEKGDFRFTKEGIKKLTTQIKELGEKEFEFKPIEVINTKGLEDFTFLEDWTTGITFNKEIEEEL